LVWVIAVEDSHYDGLSEEGRVAALSVATTLAAAPPFKFGGIVGSNL
jgi:hypothetical protein